MLGLLHIFLRSLCFNACVAVFHVLLLERVEERLLRAGRYFIAFWIYWKLFRLEDKGNFVYDFNFFVMSCWFHQIIVVSSARKICTVSFALTMTKKKAFIFTNLPCTFFGIYFMLLFNFSRIFFSLYAMQSSFPMTAAKRKLNLGDTSDYCFVNE